jgi:hypothetical protein
MKWNDDIRSESEIGLNWISSISHTFETRLLIMNENMNENAWFFLTKVNHNHAALSTGRQIIWKCCLSLRMMLLVLQDFDWEGCSASRLFCSYLWCLSRYFKRKGLNKDDRQTISRLRASFFRRHETKTRFISRWLSKVSRMINIDRCACFGTNSMWLSWRRDQASKISWILQLPFSNTQRARHLFSPPRTLKRIREDPLFQWTGSRLRRISAWKAWIYVYQSQAFVSIIRGARSTIAGDWCDFAVHWRIHIGTHVSEVDGQMAQFCVVVVGLIEGR